MPIPLGFAQVSYIFSGLAAGPGGCMTTIGVDFPAVADPNVSTEQYHEAFADNIMPALSQDVEHVETRVRFSFPGGEAVFNLFGSTPGSDTSTSLPPNAAWPVLKFTSLGGRANRGRMFLPGVPEDIVGPNGAIESSAVSAFNTQLSAYAAAMEADDNELVLLHSDPLAAPTPLVAMLSGTTVFTRGTRLRG